MIEEPFRSFVCTPEIKTKSILKPIKVVCVEKTHGLLLFFIFLRKELLPFSTLFH
jgi:hypothetical protein